MSINLTDRLNIFILFFLTLLVFSFSINYPIMSGWDDQIYVKYNQNLALSFANIFKYFTEPFFSMYAPVTMLSYMLDYSIWGLNPVGYHIQNIFWHIIATIFIYKIFRFFKIQNWIALLICLAFALSPQRVESIVWISERKDVLCAAFYFASMYCYIKSSNKTGILLSFFLFILAMLSKPMAISLPLILYLYEHYKVSSYKTIFYPKRLWSFFAIALFLAPLSYIAQGEGIKNSLSFFSKLCTLFYNLIWYAYKTILPLNLSPIYPKIQDNAETFIVLLLCAVLILSIFVFLILKKRNLFSIVLPVILSYIVALLPVSGIVELGSIDHSDRYSYIPSVFILFGIAIFLNHILYISKTTNALILLRKAIFCLLFIYTVFIAVNNIFYQSAWNSLKNLLLYSIDANYSNPTALGGLADLELEENNSDNALYCSERILALNTYKNFDPEFVQINRIRSLFIKAKVLSANRNFYQSLRCLLEIRPYIQNSNRLKKDYYPTMMVVIANCYFYTGNLKSALYTIDELLQYDKLDEFARYSILATKDYYLGNFKSAIAYREICHKLRPDHIGTNQSLDTLFKLQKRQFELNVLEILSGLGTYKFF